MKRLTVFVIKIYQVINPFKGTCRFTPTCSEYGVQAILRYGILKGLFMAVKRILKCHPRSKGGFDPVE